jgi:hypothetical protein
MRSNPDVHGACETRWKGLLRRAPAWRLTRRGWAVVVVLVLVGIAGFVRFIHPFLALNAPVSAKVLVVEGWVPDSALEAAVREFHEHGYQRVYVTGIPIERGAPLSEYKTYAALGAAVLENFGVPTNRVQAVASPDVRRDRTYACALALRDWMNARDELPASLNLLTLGVHARRSRLLYEDVFGDKCRIGVIAAEDQSYDPQRWWTGSQGVRLVVGETVAYVYARVFFHLSAERRGEKKSGEDLVESSP